MSKALDFPPAGLGPDDCWPWTGRTNNKGYGQAPMKVDVLAHRAIAVLFGGLRYGSTDVVMHTCDNPACINPAHLRIGTQAENLQDSSRKGRKSGGFTWKVGAERLQDLRRRVHGPERGVDLAREFGVSKQYVSAMRLGDVGLSARPARIPGKNGRRPATVQPG